MMRLRRASLLVSFYLLASAATAYAECAWVLWSQDYFPAARGTTADSAWKEKNECEVGRAISGSEQRGRPRAQHCPG